MFDPRWLLDREKLRKTNQREAASPPANKRDNSKGRTGAKSEGGGVPCSRGNRGRRW